MTLYEFQTTLLASGTGGAADSKMHGFDAHFDEDCFRLLHRRYFNKTMTWLFCT